jgi:hypothetical protein
LLAQLVLLLANPAYLGDGKQAHGIQAHVGGRSDSDSSSRGVNAQVDVLNVLVYDIYGYTSQRE